MIVPIHHSGGHEDGAADLRRRDFAPLPGNYLTPEEEHEELERLRRLEREVVALLGSSSSQRILHDIRNLLNEVQLLRYLADRSD